MGEIIIVKGCLPDGFKKVCGSLRTLANQTAVGVTRCRRASVCPWFVSSSCPAGMLAVDP